MKILKFGFIKQEFDNLFKKNEGAPMVTDQQISRAREDYRATKLRMAYANPHCQIVDNRSGVVLKQFGETIRRI